MTDSNPLPTSTGVIRVLDRRPERSSMYRWLEQLDRPWEGVGEIESDWQPPEDTCLLVTHRHYTPIEITVLNRVSREDRIPVLILADGILEYRNTWENPQLPPGTLFQPVLGHKLACIGRAQARIVSGWGNAGKCEVVGLPRLDSLARDEAKTVVDPTKFRVLVMTARTPGFTETQRETTRRSLRDIREWASAHPQVAGRQLEIVWRLTGDLAESLGVSNQLSSLDGEELAGVIQHVDAVVSTYSTSLLEAALLGKPVAVLDYHQVPNYLLPAWRIQHADAIGPVFNDLCDPPAARIAFQNQMLFDNLECQTPATPRLLQLVNAMIEAGERCRQEKRPLELAAQLVPLENDVTSLSVGVPVGWQEFKDDWIREMSADHRGEEVAFAQYEGLLKQYIEARDQAVELQRNLRMLEQKHLRTEDKLEKQRDKISDMQKRINQLRERVQELRDRNRQLVDSWQQTQRQVGGLQRRALARISHRDSISNRCMRLESLLLANQEKLRQLKPASCQSSRVPNEQEVSTASHTACND